MSCLEVFGLGDSSRDFASGTHGCDWQLAPYLAAMSARRWWAFLWLAGRIAWGRCNAYAHCPARDDSRSASGMLCSTDLHTCERTDGGGVEGGGGADGTYRLLCRRMLGMLGDAGAVQGGAAQRSAGLGLVSFDRCSRCSPDVSCDATRSWDGPRESGDGRCRCEVRHVGVRRREVFCGSACWGKRRLRVCLGIGGCMDVSFSGVYPVCSATGSLL